MLSDSVSFELSQAIHAERLANAERQRFASAPVHRSPADPATSDAQSLRRFASALRTFAAHVARFLCQPGRVPVRGK
jgi:hypothetical protein